MTALASIADLRRAEQSLRDVIIGEGEDRACLEALARAAHR
jgi:hypothetical protein